MNDPRAHMWAQACAMLDEAERLHRQFFRLGPAVTGRPVWEPPADLFETDDEVIVTVALPGVGPDQVEAYLDGRSLIVVGVRSAPVRNARAVHRLEIPYGRFERRVPLPPWPLELSDRTLKNGCLEVRFSKLG